MKRNTIRVGVLGLFAVMLLLAGCYAPLKNQNPSLSLSIKGIPSQTGNQAILLLIDDSYEASLAQLLWLINKGYHTSGTGGLSSSEVDQLKTLAQNIVTNGLVNFGGFPFYQVNLSGSSGSITLPGLPAGHSYLVKMFVFKAGLSFDPSNIKQDFFNNIGYQNIIFNTESYTTPYQNWTVPASQVAAVTDGGSVPVPITLQSSIP